jgi:hypothetical protein
VHVVKWYLLQLIICRLQNGKLKTETVIVSATYNILVAFFTLQQRYTNQRNGFFILTKTLIPAYSNSDGMINKFIAVTSMEEEAQI